MEWGPTGETGSPTLSDVERVQIEIPTAESEGLDRAGPVVVDSIRSVPRRTTGRVMLQFDDARDSVMNAYREMAARGMPATVAVIPHLVGESGHMTYDQLEDVAADGWDLVSHPHPPDEEPISSYSRAEQHELVRRSKSWLVTHGHEAAADHIVAPFGIVDGDTLDVMEEYHYTNYLGESVLSGTPPQDPLTIERANLDEVEFVKEQLRRAAKYDQLVAITGLTVGDPNDDRISMDEFRSVLDLIEELPLPVTTPTEYWTLVEELLASGGTEAPSPPRSSSVSQIGSRIDVSDYPRRWLTRPRHSRRGLSLSHPVVRRRSARTFHLSVSTFRPRRIRYHRYRPDPHATRVYRLSRRPPVGESRGVSAGVVRQRAWV